MKLIHPPGQHWHTSTSLTPQRFQMVCTFFHFQTDTFCFSEMCVTKFKISDDLSKTLTSRGRSTKTCFWVFFFLCPLSSKCPTVQFSASDESPVILYLVVFSWKVQLSRLKPCQRWPVLCVTPPSPALHFKPPPMVHPYRFSSPSFLPVLSCSLFFAALVFKNFFTFFCVFHSDPYWERPANAGSCSAARPKTLHLAGQQHTSSPW